MIIDIIMSLNPDQNMTFKMTSKYSKTENIHTTKNSFLSTISLPSVSNMLKAILKPACGSAKTKTPFNYLFAWKESKYKILRNYLVSVHKSHILN